MKCLRFGARGVMTDRHGLNEKRLAELVPELAAARREVLADADQWAAGTPVPEEKRPLDAGFIDLPDRLLTDFQKDKENSQVGQIMAKADWVAQEFDRVVLLGIGGSYMGARAIFEALCHPYHNELSRARRNNRPRFYFEGNNVDNDSLAGLLDLLEQEAPQPSANRRWMIVVISKSGGTLETAVAFRILLRQLANECGGDPAEIAQRIVPITGPDGRLHNLSEALGCPDVFRIPDGVGGRFSVLAPVGLFPAATMGLDIIQLLDGASAMNRHFRTADPETNCVLQFVGVSHWMEKEGHCPIRILSTWGKRLEAVGLWYDQLLAESLGKEERGATPLTIVNTRDLHSRGQQHQDGRRDKLITNLVVEESNRKPLSVGVSEHDQDALNALADKTLPDILNAAFAGTNQAYWDVDRPTADLILPKLDAFWLGQLFQMLMLATVVEGRLIKINPYGQPGVEMYKRNMNAILRGESSWQPKSPG
ncbi:MAG: glucose-6-phosphate isomerase [Pirellulales bacterium]|nr:glucose-6-phosphate isomerase [Pirellulales bacterium]